MTDSLVVREGEIIFILFDLIHLSHHHSRQNQDKSRGVVVYRLLFSEHTLTVSQTAVTWLYFLSLCFISLNYTVLMAPCAWQRPTHVSWPVSQEERTSSTDTGRQLWTALRVTWAALIFVWMALAGWEQNWNLHVSNTIFFPLCPIYPLIGTEISPNKSFFFLFFFLFF